MKTPQCGVGFVPIFERYLVATGYRPHTVDTANALRDNEFAPSPECAQTRLRFCVAIGGPLRARQLG